MEVFAIVKKVIDGDTFKGIKVIYIPEEGREERHFGKRFRLFGVNTPEKNEPGFNEATQFTSEQIAGKTVKIQLFGEDAFGRQLCKVYLEDGTCLNDLLLEKGLAKPYVKKRRNNNAQDKRQ